MARKKSIADKGEALKEFTAILRDEESKTTDKMRAAEHIVKYAEDEANSSSDAVTTPSGVMIVDDIPHGADGG